MILQEEEGMKVTRITRYGILALAISCGVAAWGAGAQKPSLPDPGASTLMYVGFLVAQQVNIYQQGHNSGPTDLLVDGLTNITGGIAVDQQKNVYITTGAGTVVVYPPGGLVPGLRYQFPDMGFPPLTSGITVDPAGTLYATLFGDRGVVAEYTKGNTQKASFVLAPPPPYSAIAVAVDAQNNLYVEYSNAIPFPQTAYIEKCAPQSDQCTNLGITLGAGGFNLAVDSQGNLIACDELAAQIDIFPPNGGQPRVISQGLNGCAYFALDKSEKYLAVGNEAYVGGPTSVSIFDYATGAVVQNITAGIPQNDILSGLAISPAALP